ncbi:endonuclease/exonuclease/phosphatase family protein [Actinoplanes cyaneus]|uniref:endonuclease/exonuclease/phosphatase family protein n=1 Tax=Actinoplanes cyaneus TaxID=52696 RepID=UPI001EF23C66|nr:endonuclease/exonuclease/phosphatase family protein [Actinoplanes cyaneus]
MPIRGVRPLALLALALTCLPAAGCDHVVAAPAPSPSPARTAPAPSQSTPVSLAPPRSPAATPSPVSSSALDLLTGPARPSDLDVMTFNLRYASEAGANTWTQRRPVMRELLDDERPDLIGTQEGFATQLRDVAADLGRDYSYLGLGRDGGDRGEHMAIFYDTTRLRAVESGDFWLSETPEVPASTSWGTARPRMVTWALFEDPRTGKRFYAANTHLDNVSENARRHGAALIAGRLAVFERLPIVLTGDFNSPATAVSEVHRTLVDRAGLQDVWATAPVRGPAYATIHNYGPLIADGERDDWILTTRGVTAVAALMNTYRRAGRYPSDHLPVQARLRLP